MRFFTLIWRNLWRNPVRTSLTIGTLAVSLFLFTLLLATVDSMQSVAAASASRLRLVVHHKTTMTRMLPLRQAAQLAAMPDVRQVCAMRWFGGRLASSQEQFPSLAMDVATFPTVFEDFNLDPAAIAAWKRERTAAIVGAGLAQRIGCGVGDRVELTSSLPPYLKLEFRVAGLTHAAAYPNVFILRLDYLLDALRASAAMPPEYNNAVHVYWVQAASPAALPALRTRVDEYFAGTPDGTMTEPEESFVAQFTKMFGDIPAIVRSVGLTVIASILLVVCNTMSSAVRERMGELAALKALGYSTPRLVMLLLGEAGLMGAIGSVGCLLAGLVAGWANGAGLSMPYFPVIAVTPWVAVAGVLAGVAVNLAAVVLPARRIALLSVTQTLRRTE